MCRLEESSQQRFLKGHHMPLSCLCTFLELAWYFCGLKTTSLSLPVCMLELHRDCVYEMHIVLMSSIFNNSHEDNSRALCVHSFILTFTEPGEVGIAYCSCCTDEGLKPWGGTADRAGVWSSLVSFSTHVLVPHYSMEEIDIAAAKLIPWHICAMK